MLRESKRTRAHRVIEMMDWGDLTSAEELAERFRSAFVENGDNMMPVDRDLRRAFGAFSTVIAVLCSRILPQVYKELY